MGIKLLVPLIVLSLSGPWKGLEFKAAPQVVDLTDLQVKLGVKRPTRIGDMCNYKANTVHAKWNNQVVTLQSSPTTNRDRFVKLRIIKYPL